MLLLRSPAKVNLFFKILGKRSDGYHEVATLMQTVALYDELSFEQAERDALTCSDPKIPTDERNLILKAADLFRKKSGLPLFVSVHLKKQIPHEAGLGGGSSNAATTLMALNQLAGTPVSQSDLQAWSAELGSDVPFFFAPSGRALCTGRGERVHPLDRVKTESLLIVKPPYGLSTPAVYAQVKVAENSKFNLEATVEAFQQGRGHLFNELESAAFYLAPDLLDYRHAIVEAGASQTLLAGSGASLFGLGARPPSQPSLPGSWYFTTF
jgi:4-diphosphocytidyl-2-C-methyl-D-erythritol kinase